MLLAGSGVQICNQCKWRHLEAKFATDTSGVTWCDNLIKGPNCLGLLCLWQCLQFDFTTFCSWQNSSIGHNLLSAHQGELAWHICLREDMFRIAMFVLKKSIDSRFCVFQSVLWCILIQALTKSLSKG